MMAHEIDDDIAKNFRALGQHRRLPQLEQIGALAARREREIASFQRVMLDQFAQPRPTLVGALDNREIGARRGGVVQGFDLVGECMDRATP